MWSVQEVVRGYDASFLGAGALPDDVADKEWAHGLNVVGGLASLAHGLNDMRQRIEFPANEADDEFVVASIESVAGETDIVGQVCFSVGPSYHGVLPQNGSLFLMRKFGKGSGPSQWVPNGPGPRRIESSTPRLSK